MVYDVAVVGAGIEGSAIAYYLLKEGLNVLLLEQVSVHVRLLSCSHQLVCLVYVS